MYRGPFSASFHAFFTRHDAKLLLQRVLCPGLHHPMSQPKGFQRVHIGIQTLNELFNKPAHHAVQHKVFPGIRRIDGKTAVPLQGIL